MKLVVDENIVQAKEAFSTFGEITFVSGREITNESLLNADILIVRSVTKVNEELLKNTKIKFVGTATIGTDHIDIDYLKKNNIGFSSAAGCNSYSVAEYIFSAITQIAIQNDFKISEKSIGVIGYGNIGTKVVKIAKALGVRVVINDPPKERFSKEQIFSSLKEALSCDIVTFHVPLNIGGVDNTVHLLDEKNINLIKENAILINTSRGPVVDNQVLKNRLKEENNIHVVLDVWEEEPVIDLDLLGMIKIATPHIAGYSYEGKVNGTKIIYDALCNYLKINKKWLPSPEPVLNNKIEINHEENLLTVLKKLFSKSYPIMEDDKLLRKIVSLSEIENPKYFDSLRKNYGIRRELNNYAVLLNKKNIFLENILTVLRLQVL